MATHHNQERSDSPHCLCSFYFVRVGKVAPVGCASGDKNGPPYGFSAREPSFHVHGDEKEMHVQPKPKTGKPPGHKINL